MACVASEKDKNKFCAPKNWNPKVGCFTKESWLIRFVLVQVKTSCWSHLCCPTPKFEGIVFQLCGKACTCIASSKTRHKAEFARHVDPTRQRNPSSSFCGCLTNPLRQLLYVRSVISTSTTPNFNIWDFLGCLSPSRSTPPKITSHLNLRPLKRRFLLHLQSWKYENHALLNSVHICRCQHYQLFNCRDFEGFFTSFSTKGPSALPGLAETPWSRPVEHPPNPNGMPPLRFAASLCCPFETVICSTLTLWLTRPQSCKRAVL